MEEGLVLKKFHCFLTVFKFSKKEYHNNSKDGSLSVFNSESLELVMVSLDQRQNRNYLKNVENYLKNKSLSYKTEQEINNVFPFTSIPNHKMQKTSWIHWNTIQKKKTAEHSTFPDAKHSHKCIQTMNIINAFLKNALCFVRFIILRCAVVKTTFYYCGASSNRFALYAIQYGKLKKKNFDHFVFQDDTKLL
uniref:Uncharacterized protein n=1 Tax=Glossina pallidipes TaxID=7398 RepID=A0A1B0GGN0_GLOPL